jgi:hypothetical protein
VSGRSALQRATISRVSSRLAEASPWMLESMCSSFMTLSHWFVRAEKLNLWDDH